MSKDRAHTIADSIYKDADMLNRLTYDDYFFRLRELAITMFEWTGLPETCNARFLEKVLFSDGIAVVVNDKNLGFMNLRCSPSSQFNVYEEPVTWRAWSIGYSVNYNAKDCVIIRNNIDMRATEYTIALFARRLYEAERTLDVNIKAQKTPILLFGNDKIRLSLKTAYQKVDGNQPVLMLDKSVIDETVLKALKTDAPYVGDKLMLYKHDVYNEVLTFLGIKNIDDKKERLVADEANKKEQIIDLSAETMLRTRKEACENLKKLWQLDVDVNLKEGINASDIIESMATESVQRTNE